MTQKIRNIAIIAHVDHGKTTLVDKLLQQTGTLNDRGPKVERMMDSNALEKERGIRALSEDSYLIISVLTDITRKNEPQHFYHYPAEERAR